MKDRKITNKPKNLAIGAIILGLLILAVIGYSYWSTHTEPQVIKIGHIGPMTSYAASYGEQERQAIDLAVSEINAVGGIKGKKLVVIHEDDQLDPTLAINALNKLITVDNVSAVIGELSSTTTLALSPIAEKNKVVLISHLANSNKISSAGDYIFRVYPANALESKEIVEFSYSLNLTDGAILYINNDFGTDMAQSLNDYFTKKGGAVLISEGYNPDATDFRTQLTKIQAKSPKVIFLLGYYKDMAIILRQARELGISSQFLAPDTFNDPQVLELSGNASEGVIFAYPDSDPARWKHFNDKIKSKYGYDAPIWSATAYDATKVLAAAMENGVTGEDIKTGLYSLKDYPAVTGNITFDKNGDLASALFVFKVVHDGKFEDYK